MLLRTGIPPSRFWHSAPDFVEGLLALRARYAFDGILVSLHGHAPDWERRIAGIDRHAGRGAHPLEVGGLDLLSLRRPARLPPGPGRRLAGFFEFRSLVPAAARRLHPRLARTALRPGPGTPLRRRRRGRRPGGPRILRPRRGDLASRLLPRPLRLRTGHGRTSWKIPAGPPRSWTASRTGSWRSPKDWPASGVDAVKISSPFAGAGFLSTAFYRTFVLPYESRIARAAEARGVRSYIHTCGDIHDRLELMAGSGASGIECLDPPPLGRVDLGDAKARVGSRIFIKGNVDPVHVLLAGDPALGPGRRPPAAGRGQARRPLYPELGLLDRPPHAGRERPGPGRGRRAEGVY